MTITIQKPSERPYRTVLIHAPSGHGKTRFIGTAQLDPRTSPCLVLDFEGGTGSLAGLDIDIIAIHSWDDYNDAYAWIADALERGDFPYRSIAVDSVTETQIWALLKLLADDERNRKLSDQLDQSDYGRAYVQMRKLIRAFRDLPIHVIFSALSEDVIDPRVGKVKAPSFAGKFQRDILGVMSDVVYLGVVTDTNGATQRELILCDTPGFVTKVRLPWNVQSVPTSIIEPTVTKLFDILQIPVETPPQGETENASDQN